jgi:MinD-like ATPase involved in chromosome partitioning or flagellar assembly
VNSRLRGLIKQSQPRVVTFYSFKGGVGRTLTLVNVAFALAARGKNVILMDFDLEAPGLDAFPLLRPTVPISGFLEYVEEYVLTGLQPDPTRYLAKVHESPGEGRIWAMYAGRFDDTYPERLGRIDWTDFYVKLNGYQFFERLKDDLREKYSPDYVLIDSRTGQADVAGIATIHLPDLVVLMYALDEQNLRGAARMAEVIRNNRVGRAIKLIPVACRVPITTDYSELQANRLDEAEQRGIPPAVILPYESYLAFGETVLRRVNGRSRGGSAVLSPLRSKIEELTDQIIKANVQDVDNLLEEARSAFVRGNRERVWELYSSASRSSPSAKTWLEFGTFLIATGRQEDAIQALGFARELDPDWPEPIIKLAQAASLRNPREAIAYAHQYIKAGGKSYEDVLSLADVLHRANQAEGVDTLLRWCDQSNQPDFQIRARHSLTLILIAQSQFNEALRIFEDTFARESQLMREVVWIYNYAETLRRMKRSDALETFGKFVQLAELDEDSNQNFDASLIAHDANYLQASGHALALIGRKDKAAVFMQRAMDVARGVRKDDRIFSTVSYKWERPDAFIQQTQALLNEDVGIESDGSHFEEKRGELGTN